MLSFVSLIKFVLFDAIVNGVVSLISFLDYLFQCIELQLTFFFKILLTYLERGEGKEEEAERNINVWLPPMCPQLGTWPATQACALTGN